MRLRRKLTALGIATVLAWVGTTVAYAPPAHAVSREVRTVLMTSGIGMLGGAALGLATFPFNRDAKTIAIGASVGLYLGLAVGIFSFFSTATAISIR